MRRCADGNTAKVFLGLAFISALFFGCFDKNIVLAQNTNTANLFFSTPSTNVKEGQRITINVEVNSGAEAINAVSGTVSFPGNLVRVISLSKDNSIIKLWTQEPKLRSSDILFEGIILNPGFQGNNGLVFTITFEAEASGTVNLTFNDGAVLANNGLGTNVLATLSSTDFNILPGPAYANTPLAIKPPTPTLPNTGTQVALVLPSITKYFPAEGPKEYLYVQGSGAPYAFTKISFQNLSVKSLGDKLVAFFQGQKNSLGDVVVENDKKGVFHYLSDTNLVAGVYNATPALVDPNNDTEIPGGSIQLLVSDSIIVRDMVVLLNILGLLIPMVFLIVLIYFIPWYSWRRMRIMKQKMLLEEEKVELTAEDLKNKSIAQNTPVPIPTPTLVQQPTTSVVNPPLAQPTPPTSNTTNPKP